ncbi:protein phosphatase 1 regulatory subunit 3A isoform X2 [Narcine bancroftii]|uniref:protein phosphatase 1 regulatory subunit 3A isoform X2 n=1 Tax=Narcine bancroftii TaxID=1343680 RepID=UPI003832140E
MSTVTPAVKCDCLKYLKPLAERSCFSRLSPSLPRPMEPVEKERNSQTSVRWLELPTEDDVLADGEILIHPQCSPLPRRRSSSSDEGLEPPLNLHRKVSFADAFGLELVSVREFDKWEVGGRCALPGGAPEERAPREEYVLLPLFQLPSSPEELKQKLYAQKVELESAEFPPGATCMTGLIRVLNLSYDKLVSIRMTLNNWESYSETLADYVAESCDGETDQFSFKILLVPPYVKDGAKVEFAIRYEAHGAVHWANNAHKNYVVLCHKKDGPNGNGKLQEDLDDRNLKSCLKTSYREILNSSWDDGLTISPSFEVEQEDREVILEIKTIPQWNTESPPNENSEQKEFKSEQQRDTQVLMIIINIPIHPPLHISLTNLRGQETNLIQLEGLYYEVKEGNKENAAIVSESPVIQQKDLEVEHVKSASTNIYTESKVKHREEYEWVEIPSASSTNTSDLKAPCHKRDGNTTKPIDSVNVATSSNNTVTQSSEWFPLNNIHLQHKEGGPFSQKRNETVTLNVIDTSTKTEQEIHTVLQNNPYRIAAADMQNNLGLIQDVIDRYGEVPGNVLNPTDLEPNSIDSEDKNEETYLIADVPSISTSVSFPVSTICTNTDLKFEPEKIRSSFRGSMSSEEIQIFNATLRDSQEPSQGYTKAENLETVRPEDFPRNLIPRTRGQKEQMTNRTAKVILPLTEIPGSYSTDKGGADEQKGGATQLVEQRISVPSCTLADTMVKEAIEAALFEVGGDEGTMFSFASQKAKPIANDAQISEQRVLNLTSRHREPSNIHFTKDQNATDVSQFGEPVTEMSTARVQMAKVALNAAQKITEEETSASVSPCTRTSPLPLGDAFHPDLLRDGKQSLELVQNLTAAFQTVEENLRGGTPPANFGKSVSNVEEMVPDLQEEAEKILSHESTEMSEKIPENVLGLKNCEIKQVHAEDGEFSDVPGEEGYDEEKGNEKVKDVKLTQNFNILNVEDSLEVGKVDLEQEEASSMKNTLYGKRDESMKIIPTCSGAVRSQMATEALLTLGLTAAEGGHGKSAECEKVENNVEVDHETIVEKEISEMFSESMGVHYFEKIEMLHGTRHSPTNRSTNQNAAEPKDNTKLGSNTSTSNETKWKKIGVTTLPQDSELSNKHKCFDPVMLTGPVKEKDGKETNTDVISDILLNSEQLKSRECNEKINALAQVREAFDSSVDGLHSQLSSEPFMNEITLKNTVWKVCYFVLFVVFLVTIYHYDFIGCFALYLFSLYWLYCEGETNSDSVRKD